MLGRPNIRAGTPIGLGGIADLDRGEGVLFESGEMHVFHNRSTTEPLVIFSIYWMPRIGAVTPPAREAITA
ncbi:MAG: hypothetical protein QOJ69_1749 [Actinomycetota bacterium]|nr:hypothetical protein [Actinomycetota bacterium]